MTVFNWSHFIIVDMDFQLYISLLTKPPPSCYNNWQKAANLILMRPAEELSFLPCETICEAMETLKHHTCDLMILDINPPDGNGMNLLGEIRKRPYVGGESSMIRQSGGHARHEMRQRENTRQISQIHPTTLGHGRWTSF